MKTPKDIITYKKESKIVDDSILNVDCPHCYEENTIDTVSVIRCEKCEKPLLSKKDSNFLISSIVAAFIGTGAVAGVMLDDGAEIYRLPLKVEYKMIKTCIDRFSENGSYDKKLEIYVYVRLTRWMVLLMYERLKKWILLTEVVSFMKDMRIVKINHQTNVQVFHHQMYLFLYALYQ